MSRPIRAAFAGCVLLLASIATTAPLALASTPKPETPAVVNGTSVSASDFAGKWQFLVALVNPEAESQFDGQFCGGSLIDDQHVLTAAHCIQVKPGFYSNSQSVGIIAKTRTLDDHTLGTGETGVREVSDIFVHPGFGENPEGGFHNDVAVIRLAQPVTGVTPIGLVQAGDTALWGNGAGGVDAFVAGWGNTDPAGAGNPALAYPTTLMQATVPVRSDAVCAATDGGGYGTAFERATNFCAGVRQTDSTHLGIDTCQGDSGGPLLVDAGAGTFKLAGATSWGEGCAQENFGAYTRLDALRTWVDSIPGATDGGAAIGGPDNLQAVTNAHREAATYSHVTLAWNAPAGGTAPERYAIWKRTNLNGDSVDELMGITTGTSFGTNVAPAKTSTGIVWNIRALDSVGSNGDSTLLTAGPLADTVAPSTTRPVLSKADPNALIVVWNAATDAQSGVGTYTVQRHILGRKGGWVTIGHTTAGHRAMKITRLPSGARVAVRIRAEDKAGNAGIFCFPKVFTTKG